MLWLSLVIHNALELLQAVEFKQSQPNFLFYIFLCMCFPPTPHFAFFPKELRVNMVPPSLRHAAVKHKWSGNHPKWLELFHPPASFSRRDAFALQTLYPLSSFRHSCRRQRHLRGNVLEQDKGSLKFSLLFFILEPQWRTISQWTVTVRKKTWHIHRKQKVVLKRVLFMLNWSCWIFTFGRRD